jgi:hypothetical protein
MPAGICLLHQLQELVPTEKYDDVTNDVVVIFLLIHISALITETFIILQNIHIIIYIVYIYINMTV